MRRPSRFVIASKRKARVERVARMARTVRVARVARPERMRWAWESWQMSLTTHTPFVPQSVPHVSITFARVYFL